MGKLKESNLNYKDVKIALNNALKNGEEFDIPWKYSDEFEFTKEFEKLLDKEGYEFVGSFHDNKYGNMSEYVDDFDQHIYTIDDPVQGYKTITTGILSDKVYHESKKSNRKSMKETINKSTWGDWIVSKVERVDAFYNGSPNVSPKLINSLIEDIGLNANGHILTFDDIADEISKGVRAYKLKDLDGWCIHLGHNNNGLRVDLNAKVSHFSEVLNHNGKYTVISVYFYLDEQGTNEEYDFGFTADVLVEINPYVDFVLEESKKSVGKSLTEKNTVNYWDKLHNIIPLDTRNESYRFATMCVTNLYNDDEYDSEDALIYFIDCYLSDKYPSWEDEVDMEELATMLYKGKMKWKDIDKSWFESKKSARKSMKESFDDGDQLVIDVVDMLILDFGYDKKTVEKYFYKIHKLNDFDTISIDEYIKIKEEIEKALGYDDIF